ncbi:MAG: S8 family serine peptidase, partial [Cyclobacteriaceae bacterium]|nr:S8 family serine peptidase [Cyclobacteriaceae bacterium]
MKRVVILILCSFSFYGIFAQSHRYFIAFTDKANSPFLKAQPEAFLSQKSIQRRTIQNIAIETADLPVDPAYILELRNQGAETFYASRWLNGVLVQATPALAATLEGLPFVKSVEYVASGAPLIYGGRFDRAMDKLDLSSSVDSIQKDLLGIEIMHNQSFLGQGIEIAVLDAGFIGVNSIGAFSHLYQNSKVTNVFNFSGNSTNVYQYHDHGTVVLSTISANIPGYYTGTAPDAEIQLYVTEDVFSEYRVEEYYWLFAAEMADSAGVDIITSSLGYFDFDDPSMNYTPADLNGNTAVISRAADLAALRGMVVITSAGNQGNKAWGKITFPADCHYCLSVGAITKDG